MKKLFVILFMFCVLTINAQTELGLTTNNNKKNRTMTANLIVTNQYFSNNNVKKSLFVGLEFCGVGFINIKN
jgi:hypothetical protein